jgi:hypothetical protein
LADALMAAGSACTPVQQIRADAAHHGQRDDLDPEDQIKLAGNRQEQGHQQNQAGQHQTSAPRDYGARASR